MSRFCWSFVTCGLAVSLAGSFEAVRAQDKDLKQPVGDQVRSGQGAGTTPRVPMPTPRVPMPIPRQPARLPSGQGTTVKPGQGQALLPGVQKQTSPLLPAPRGTGKAPDTPLQPFLPNKTTPGGLPAGGSSTPGNIGGGATPGKGTLQRGAGPGANIGDFGMKTAIPQGAVGRLPGGNIPGAGTIDAQGNPMVHMKTGANIPAPGTPMSIFDRWGKKRDSVKKPEISVEPGPGALIGDYQQPLGGPGQKRTFFDIFTEVDVAGKTKPLAVPKPGGLRHEPIVITSQGDEVGRRAVPKPGKLPIGDDDDKQSAGETKVRLQPLLQAKNRDDLHRELKSFQVGLNDHIELKHPTLPEVSGFHQDRLAKPDSFQHWQQSKLGQKLGLEQQFQFQRQGDLSRRLNLSTNLINAGGWLQHRQYGVIAPGFTSAAFSVWYAGGGCFPAHAWCPTWSPWVDWSYWGTCPVFYDPRPFFCIPYYYGPCLPWVYYDYPVWVTLPVVSCGTWIDVSPIVVAGQDVQLLAVRFVDNGHPEQNLGPRYRVWVRNNSPVQIVAPFSVLLLASNEQTPTVELPQTGVVVTAMDIGETQALDIRLPLAANRLGVTPEGYRVPFTYLHTLVDSHQQIPEMFEDNNGAVLARTDILPVDPAAFSTDLTAAAPESLLTIAGEGFGPEPGKVIFSVYDQQVQAEIHGWYDLGIQFAVPNFALTQPIDAEVLVVRGDSAVSNPLTVRLAPQELLEVAVVIPESPIPSPTQ